jgi:NAD-dependent SIR2 family protein deacetylase
MIFATTTGERAGADDVERLARFITDHPRLFVLTGAGVSTDSGIPDYRDGDGNWKRPQPVRYQEFVGSESVRRRYWARSLIGWPRFACARPGVAHTALARLETAGVVHRLVTQNVDRLHQQAGSREVIDLHGRLDRVQCLDCGAHESRHDYQQRLAAHNPAFAALPAATAPDGDADLDGIGFDTFDVPGCARCGGMLKPAVVFFGECVPQPIVTDAYAQLAAADALLVIGSSLMVYSGYRFARTAAAAGKPIAAINLGRTRADELLTVKWMAPCGEALETLVKALSVGP